MDIHEVNALVVVADAPSPGHDDDAHFQGLKRLASALALLRQSQSREKALKFHMPVALLVSKWDRAGCPAWNHPEDDDLKLRAWLTPGDTSADPQWSIHIQILQYLKSSFEHCAAFPVSAFGAHKTAPSPDAEHPGTRELPAGVEPLRSFNLEAPFLWCARTLDESVITNLEEQLRRRLSPWPIHRGAAFARLCNRTPKGGNLGCRLADFTRRSQRRARLLTVGWGGLLIIIALLAQY